MPGIIAAGHHETAKAGQEILEAGGNAFDAAIGAAFTSFVAEPSLTSMGGGGFMLTYSPGKEPRLYDFFVHTPRHRHSIQHVDFVEAHIDFGAAIQRQFIGKGSVAVPGCAAGLFRIHEDLGSMPISEIAQPAIRLARQGCTITPYQEYTFSILKSILLHSEESARVYGKDGRLLQEGEKCYLPQFADTLEFLCREGVREFYEGEIGIRLARDHAGNGGSLSLEDLAAYEVRVRTPLRSQYRGHTLLTNPPPSAGGSMITLGLALLSQWGVPLPDRKSHEYARILGNVMNAMHHGRIEKINDSPHPEKVMAEVLNQEYLFDLRKRFDLLGNTTHISVMDSKGNAAGITTTLGGASGEMIPGTDMILNNMLGELDLFPLGNYTWPENIRVSSMMSPSIILREGAPWVTMGSGGSSRIRTALLQVALNLIDHKLSIRDAVLAPRLHWEDYVMNMEPGFLSDKASFFLDDGKIVHWPNQHMFFGGVHAVCRESDGSFAGIGDPRRSGACLQVS